MRFYEKPKGMPRPLYLALTRRDYTAASADYSVTTLLKPPRVLALERRYHDRIFIDCRKNAKALLGTAWHDHLERKAKQYPEACEIVEEIMLEEIEVEVNGELRRFTIKGQPDLHNTEERASEGGLFALEDGILWDYKTCSQWVAHPKYGPKKDWTAQLNIYGWMLRRRGKTVTSLKICPMYTNWKKRDKLSDFAIGDAIELPLWPDSEIEAFIKERIVLHETVKMLHYDELPLCTPEDRWMNAKWMVRKKGDPTFKMESFGQDEAAARDRAVELGLGYVAFYKADEARRCNDWCDGALFCKIYKDEFPEEYAKQLQTRLEMSSEPFEFEFDV